MQIAYALHLYVKLKKKKTHRNKDNRSSRGTHIDRNREENGGCQGLGGGQNEMMFKWSKLPAKR